MASAPKTLSTCALSLLTVTCSPGAEAELEAASPGAAGLADRPVLGAAPVDPRVQQITDALEAGLPHAAWTLLDQLRGSLGVEGGLLRARAALLEGDPVGSQRELEDVRALAGDDPRLVATEVEILAALDRTGTARELLREGMQRHGLCGPLERARGVLLLRTPGGGVEALAALTRARELEPELRFVSFPLAQAHLLAGRAQMGADPEIALQYARAAREHAPDNPDYRELEAEALTALLQFEEALELYEELEREGSVLVESLALLHQRYATHLLVFERDRDGALREYLHARALGMQDEGLGFGATVLAEESGARVDAGLDHYEEGDLEQAATAFEEALRFDPRSVEARNHLGVCRFRAEEFLAAAELWTEVVDDARARALELPDPVHLNLARAWRLAGEPERARRTLSDYLEQAPEGVWSRETRELLELLDAEPESDG